MHTPARKLVNRLIAHPAMRFVSPMLLVLIFIGAAWLRFTQIPLVPIHDGDSWGYVGPAISVFINGHFQQSYRSFPYPGFLYLVLRQFQDFEAIVIVQSCIGLLGGVFLWLAWLKLECFFPARPGVSIAHRTLGLLMMAGYLFSINHALLEHSIRPESIFPALTALQIWISLIFIEEAFVRKRAGPMCVAGFFMAFQGILLCMVKPLWGLAVFDALVPLAVALLMTRWPKWLLSCILVSAGIAFLVLFWLPEKHLHEKYRPEGLSFGCTTLFCFHAKYIYPELIREAHSSGPVGYDRKFLGKVAGGVKAVLDNPPGIKIYPSLGFNPDLLQWHSDTINQIETYFNDPAKCSAFFMHCYWMAWLHQPIGMGGKIVRELGLFYHFKSDVTKTRKSPYWFREPYSRSLELIEGSKATLQFGGVTMNNSIPKALVFNEGSNTITGSYDWPLLDRHVESVRKLANGESFIRQDGRISLLHMAIDRTYLIILIAIVLLAVRSRQSPKFYKANRRFVVSPFPLIFWLFSFNFVMTLGVAILHSMKVGRYTEIQFAFTLFSYFAALLVVITLLLERFKPVDEASTY